MSGKIETCRISEIRKRELFEFCKSLGLKFKDMFLLNLAFTHCSFANENSMPDHMNNERLEFLGDSVLGMATATFLYNEMPDSQEGALSKIKSVVVSEKILAPVALKFGIDKMLVLGHGEEMSGGRKKPAILADCVEAIIGAYYLDAGYAAAEKFILSFIVPEIRIVQQNHGLKDYKSMLQEWYQKKTKMHPVYAVVDTTGPDHDQTFFVTVSVGEKVYGPATGKNKKEAEQHAAEIAFRELVGE